MLLTRLAFPRMAMLDFLLWLARPASCFDRQRQQLARPGLRRLARRARLG